MSNWTKIGIGALLFVLITFSTGVGIYTNWLWFQSLGYSSVYLTILSTRVWVGVLVGGIFFAFAFANVWFAQGLMGRWSKEDSESGNEYMSELQGLVIPVIVVVSFFVGVTASSGWDTVLRYLNGVNFETLDPIFNRDIGFYVFTLPFYEFLWRGIFYGILLTTIIVAVVYMLQGKGILLDREAADVSFSIPKFSFRAKAHLSLLAALLLLTVAWGYQLNMFKLLYSTRSQAFFGASYTDMHVQLPVLKILIAISVLSAILFLVNIKYGNIMFPAIGLGLLIFFSVVGGGVYPNIIQQYRVLPNEIDLETPYIKLNIDYTNKAYGLDNINERLFPVTYNLTAEDIQSNNITIRNIRLWDHRPLLSTYKQLQEIRLYYDFRDADIDRYNINGNYRQMMLSARELSQSQLSREAMTWVNEHLVFTHGYGVVMSPVNEITREGLPNLFIKDIPPVSMTSAPIVERPEIYYGEVANEYVVVRTQEKEFDYPKGDKNIYTTYAGRGGVPLDSFFKKAGMAIRFKTVKLFLSGSITSESRIMFHRNIHERARVIAPFIEYDSDPYIVISDGRLYWIQDAYTVTDRYPYSDPFGRINYIRNSVKVVIDAYNGDVVYYVIDENDPLIQTYINIFPDLFRTFDEMPDGLKRHIRYPEDLFTIQATKYATYHMKDPKVFYNKEDLWTVPNEIFEGNEQKMVPYYVIIKLPQEDKEEFMLILPFTPMGKKNMISWMAAKSDQPDYGELVVYKFPKDALVFGPMQIEARIDQDPEISESLTLWGQSGSSVTRGNLLVIPIEDSVIYVEPLYIRAATGELPELKRIIVVHGNTVSMRENLENSLNNIFGAVLEVPSGIGEISRGELIERALQHYEQAQEFLKQGDWAGYGNELEKLKEALVKLNETSD